MQENNHKEQKQTGDAFMVPGQLVKRYYIARDLFLYVNDIKYHYYGPYPSLILMEGGHTSVYMIS